MLRKVAPELPIKSAIKAVVPSSIRRSIRNVFNRSVWRSFRSWPVIGSFATRYRAKNAICVSHLDYLLEDDAVGPIQQTEALLLFALVKATRPAMLVEFGFNRGDSALNFLRALPSSSTLHSYDISETSRNMAVDLAMRHSNFRYHHKSQAAFSPGDVDGRPVNFVFLDAAHDLSINQDTWRALEPALSEDAIVVVHDTGTWHRKHFLPIHEAFSRQNPERWLNSVEYQHQIEERQFVNWVVESRPFSAVHVHSGGVLRHGMTILQRSGLLPVTPNEKKME